MKAWVSRTYEERNLLNPAFCSLLIWNAAMGASKEAVKPRASLSFLEAFLILPLVLHLKTRESLPSRLNTSMAVWIDSQPLIISSLPQRAKSLNAYTKEAVIFGGTSNIFEIKNHEFLINYEASRKINKELSNSTDEVRSCMKKAEFLGRWFAHTGTPETVFTLIGVRP